MCNTLADTVSLCTILQGPVRLALDWSSLNMQVNAGHCCCGLCTKTEHPPSSWQAEGSVLSGLTAVAPADALLPAGPFRATAPVLWATACQTFTYAGHTLESMPQLLCSFEF